ncbi:hypothetical protein BG003_008025 [Podila horticola]|nr:hypothetical protein BG003_008025 [Podila horticola]
MTSQNMVPVPPPIPFPQTEINIAALEDVKTRLSQLQESIVFFLRTISPENQSPVSWTELHSKFNVLIAKYVHLTNLLNGPHNNLLQSYTVFPHETPANDQFVQTMSVLLRTKLTPELEQEDEDRTKEGNISGLVASPSAGTAEERRILAAYKLKISMHDALCQAADEVFENQRDTVHTRVRYGSEDEGQTKAGGSAQRQQQKSTHTAEELDALSFLESIQADQVQYLDDWAGSVVGTPGYESEEWSDDETFGETRPDVQELQRNSDYYESSDSEMEEKEEQIPEAQAQPVVRPQVTEEEDEEDEDAFMEVATESPAFGSMSGVQPGSSMIMEDLGGDDEDEGESDEEEDMEEVQ